MATPLYKGMKTKGTSFYAFPSAAEDMNLAFSNDHYKISFTKFALLNIPEQEVKVSSGVVRDQTKGVFNFDKNDEGPRFYNFQPGKNADLPSTFGNQLIESLRNYVANYDSTLRESRINVNTDFYNINEKNTPTEMIFWKWCKKLNLIDFEPALHKIDWDRNNPDFVNPNGSNYDYFQKYLWKERDVTYYTCSVNVSSIDGDKAMLTISQDAKFKVNDIVLLSGSSISNLSASTPYTVFAVEHNTNETVLHIDVDYVGTLIPPVCTVYLKYQRLIEYIGEVQSTSKVQTSKRNFTEITALLPHQGGRTPNVLFEIETNTNYYPGLEMPILPQEQQEELVGSENTNSPIRLTPQNYPGTYFGYFDTFDKTYKCTSGDKLRYKGDYYGVLLTNNIGTRVETYFEKLRDFNSDNLDGLKIDVDRNHYLKMNLPNQALNNFDEFSSAYFDGAPEDFDFNAILWYYEIDDGSGSIVNNLYGIEFLNNPSNDDDSCDTTNKKITKYKKFVSNGEQDGVSYIFNLNFNFSIDNDVLPMSYDPTTIYNNFGFDLYQNVLQTNAKLQDNFMTIISGFTNINDELFDLRSLIYSQTDIDTIKTQITNLNDLLGLYSTFQFVDSDTTSIETNFNGSYPTLKVNAINTKYSDITDINTSNILYYNNINSGVSYNIAVPLSNQMLLNVYNDNNDFSSTATISLNRDLSYKQAMDIYIMPNLSTLPQSLNINIMYNGGAGTSVETLLISGITLPVDLTYYNNASPSSSTYKNSYYTNTNIDSYGISIITGVTSLKLNISNDLFVGNDYVYIDNFYLTSGSTITDYSGVYQISSTTSGYSHFDSIITLNIPSNYFTLKTKPKVSFYKGMKINILRVSSSSSSSLADRYKITKELL